MSMLDNFSKPTSAWHDEFCVLILSLLKLSLQLWFVLFMLWLLLQGRHDSMVTDCENAKHRSQPTRNRVRAIWLLGGETWGSRRRYRSRATAACVWVLGACSSNCASLIELGISQYWFSLQWFVFLREYRSSNNAFREDQIIIQCSSTIQKNLCANSSIG